MNNHVPQVLKELFGYDTFRPNQREIVEAILNRQDAFVVMPTGGGKSLCYQLPAHIMPGTCMVVSPLISLMKDQVDAARAIGLRAAYLNSSMSGSEQARVMRELEANQIDLIYVSPERFAMEHFLAMLGRVKLSFVAIDEAHCVSEWGHDFRPDYLALSEIITRFPSLPVAAFTATATWRVQQDIIERLRLRSPHRVRASFNRANLFYRVLPKDDPEGQILAFVAQHPGEAGIVYRTTRKSVEDTAALLAEEGIRALPYHAGLSPEERATNQEAFNRDEVDVIVATIAFGMGIDKSNVRYVIHGDLPKNIESYYQETGRAGRDGEPATCLLLFSRGDIPKMRYFIDQIQDEEEHQHAVNCLRDMEGYASLNVCRRKQLLGYFGETYGQENCGTCDVCVDETDREDATREAQMVMSAIKRTGQTYGIGHIVDVVTGANTERIRKMGHDQIKTYGVGKHRDKRYWRFLIDNLLAQDMIERTADRYPVLKLCAKGEDVLHRGLAFFVLRQKETRAGRRRRTVDGNANPELMNELRGLRKRIADESSVPPYVVFSDRTIHQMAIQLPATDEQMLAISGVGRVKNERYGADFQACIRHFRKSHPEVTPAHPPSGDLFAQEAPRRKRVLKSSTYEATRQLLSQGLDIDQVAARRELAVNTIVGHMERLIEDGREVVLETERYIEPLKRAYIEELFAKHGMEALAPVVADADGKVSYAEARLVRLHMRLNTHKVAGS